MRVLLFCFAALAAARAPGPFGQSGDAPLPVHETKSTAMPTDANSKEQTFVRRRAVPAKKKSARRFPAKKKIGAPTKI